MFDISIHSLRMEGDTQTPHPLPQLLYFNPLPPYGGRRNAAVRQIGSLLFQSTPSVWRETQPRKKDNNEKNISIHSLRMEGDCGTFLFLFCFNISIHSLRMEGDVKAHMCRNTVRYFNPLPPYGGRLHAQNQTDQILHFNPLPPYGGRLFR